jgi:hydroxymethylbilane synthase
VTPLRIGTRGSQLALWQANTVARLIAERTGTICELVIIRTGGDEPPDPPTTSAASSGTSTPGTLGTPGTLVTPLTSIKATFVKEIEDALLDGRVDAAVHSSKDLAAESPRGLRIAAALPREDPRDALLLPRGETVADIAALSERLGEAPRLGTSSVRRVAQLRRVFARGTFVPIRGNVDTRLRKLDAGECDACVLACAGLRRLGFSARISLALPVAVMVPAPGQGIVSIQTRDDQPDIAQLVGTINNADAMDALAAERAVVRALGGGCQMPLGAYARPDGDGLELDVMVISQDGQHVVRERARGRRTDAESIGEALTRTLLDRGAGRILRGDDLP